MRLLDDAGDHPFDRLILFVEQPGKILGVPVNAERQLRQVMAADREAIEPAGKLLWKAMPGNRGRIENLKWARNNCDGLFRVVMIIASDADAIPRSIVRRYPDPALVMRLISLDEETGEFRAEGKR